MAQISPGDAPPGAGGSAPSFDRHLRRRASSSRQSLSADALTGAPTPEDQPLPLILYPSGCVCRDLALAALDRDERPWRIAYATRSLTLIEQALGAGFGVSVMERATIPRGMVILDGQPGFAPLADVTICLHRRTTDPSGAVALMAQALTAQLLSSPPPEGRA